MVEVEARYILSYDAGKVSGNAVWLALLPLKLLEAEIGESKQ